MRPRAASLSLLALLSLVAGAGCKRRGAPAPPPRPALGAVVVRDLTPPDEAPAAIDAAAIQRQLHDDLAASGVFAPATAADARGDGPAGPVTRVRADVAVESAEVGQKGV